MSSAEPDNHNATRMFPTRWRSLASFDATYLSESFTSGEFSKEDIEALLQQAVARRDKARSFSIKLFTVEVVLIFILLMGVFGVHIEIKVLDMTSKSFGEVKEIILVVQSAISLVSSMLAIFITRMETIVSSCIAHLYKDKPEKIRTYSLLYIEQADVVGTILPKPPSGLIARRFVFDVATVHAVLLFSLLVIAIFVFNMIKLAVIYDIYRSPALGGTLNSFSVGFSIAVFLTGLLGSYRLWLFPYMDMTNHKRLEDLKDTNRDQYLSEISALLSSEDKLRRQFYMKSCSALFLFSSVVGLYLRYGFSFLLEVNYLFLMSILLIFSYYVTGNAVYWVGKKIQDGYFSYYKKKKYATDPDSYGKWLKASRRARIATAIIISLVLVAALLTSIK